MIQLKNISKSYAGLSVLRDVTLTFEDGGCYCIMSPSGSGKTTLLRILMGLEHPDTGSIEVSRQNRPDTCSMKLSGQNSRDTDSIKISSQDSPDTFTISAVFQEDRLCESFSPLENVLMCAGKSMKPSRIRWELAKLLPEECLSRPVSTLSGGMKRRVAVLRALLTPSDILLMDEPFTGMDETLKRDVITYIKEKQNGRLLILTTHQEEDVDLIGGTLVRM